MWWDAGDGPIYPNIYVLLIGPPGTGKSRAIGKMERLLVESGGKMGPQDMSKQGLLDKMAHKDSVGGWYYKDEDGTYQTGDYHYLTLAISEIADFMPIYEPMLPGLCTKFWDCLDVNSESKRHGLGKNIACPGMSMIVGAATRSLGNIVPNQEWGTGFTARLMLVYSEEEISTRLGLRASDDKMMFDELLHHLQSIIALQGPMHFQPSALDMMQDFMDTKVFVPHPRLEDYYKRRWFHLAKLCMIAALSDTRMIVTAEDFDKALSWLLLTEDAMMEIFPKMFSNADGTLMDEIGHFVAEWCKTNPFILGTDLLFRFRHQADVYRLNKAIEMAETMDILSRTGGTNGPTAEYRPGRRGTER